MICYNVVSIVLLIIGPPKSTLRDNLPGCYNNRKMQNEKLRGKNEPNLNNDVNLRRSEFRLIFIEYVMKCRGD